MAYDILHFDGTVTPPGGAYPYGQIKDDPGGTRANVKSNGDLQQFFQRIMADAALVPNNLPDNTSNGFQLVEALIILINQQASVLSNTYGASSTTPVILSGMISLTVGGTTTISSGWFFYNGKLTRFAGNTFAAGTYVLVTITTPDGLPTGVPSATGSPITPDATHFDFATCIADPITTLNSSISTLNTEIALGAWTNISLGTGWSSSPGTQPQYRVDGLGRVYLRGTATAGPGATLNIGNLVSGARPATNQYYPAFAFLSSSATISYIYIDAGGVMAVGGTFVSGDYYHIDGIIFLNS